MKNIAVFFGGRTAEHDVSVVTAAQCMENLAPGYTIIPIYIARDGLWYTGEKLRDIHFYNQFDPAAVQRCMLPAEPGASLQVYQRKGFRQKRTLQPIDAALLAMHGMHGEDGTLQGLLELADIPYTSCGVGSAAAGMDKIIMKHVLRGCGLPVVDDYAFTRDAYDRQPQPILDAVEQQLGYPVFVKPASLGSSIGIGRATNRAELADCIELACQYDRRVLVERSVENAREVNCSAMGINSQVSTSAIEEPLRAQDFLSFEDKYLSGGGKSNGMQTLKRRLPADIPDEVAAQVTQLTREVFLALDCRGVVRIDYLLNPQNQVFINEINTIPGSMAYYLWEPQGLSFTQLLDQLLQTAQLALEDKHRNHYAFTSGILQQYAAGAQAGSKGGAKGGAKIPAGKI